MNGRTLALASLALLAFAANSILCRLALGSGRIDAASFTTLRLLAGVAVLAPLARGGGARGGGARAGSWRSGAALALYAVPFSFAYLSLSAGAGALILFGAVQATMIAAGLRTGERPGRLEWVGWGAALTGLLYLVAPGLEAPSAYGSALMALAGVAWGIYSLRGRRTDESPRAATAGNFVRAAPWALLVSLLTWRTASADLGGALLATLSGGVTSGLGYVAWYAALPGLGATRAAMAQLAVPAIASLGGTIFLGERFTARLAAASALVLGGVALALRGRSSDVPR